MLTVKKYANRRLYDSGTSRYVTLDELTARIRDGEDVMVIDAGSGEDITRATLAQIVVENRGAARLLPVPLLTQLIRMGDDALAEFFGQYMSWFFELYLQTKHGALASAPFNPFDPASYFQQGASARPATAEQQDEITALRRDLEALKERLTNHRGQNS